MPSVGSLLAVSHSITKTIPHSKFDDTPAEFTLKIYKKWHLEEGRLEF